MTRTRGFLLALLTLALSSRQALAFSTAPTSAILGEGCIATYAVRTSSTALNESLWDDGRKHRQTTPRRDVLSSLSFSTVVFLTLLPSSPASAGLLDEYGADPSSSSEKKTKKNGVVKELARAKGKPESNMEPNLRSNYYYPTNKVRYLPRIKKCSDSIPGVAEAIGNEDWDTVRVFATVVANDAILPMKLYVSSLNGGGTNVKVGFAKDMMAATKLFEKDCADLVKGTDKCDVAKTSAALEGMAEAMLAYRTSGRLLGPDGGGDIPSVDEIRRSTKRFRGEAYEAKVKERDARLKAVVEAGM